MADTVAEVVTIETVNAEADTSEVSPKEETKQEEYKVFVGNLAFSTDEQQLADFFNKTGKV
jgi:RNA recognition motif-containing protein